MDTLPKRLTPPLLAFCATISSERPAFIPSRPSSDAHPGHCFDNVARKIERSRGNIAYGWAIWHLPGAYYEAEHHGVWRKRSGELVDVSPQFNGYPKILFLPDPGAVYDPHAFRSNRLAPDGADSRSIDITGLVRERYEVLDACRARGAASLDPQSQWQSDQLLQRIAGLLRELPAPGGD